MHSRGRALEDNLEKISSRHLMLDKLGLIPCLFWPLSFLKDCPTWQTYCFLFDISHPSFAPSKKSTFKLQLNTSSLWTRPAWNLFCPSSACFCTRPSSRNNCSSSDVKSQSCRGKFVASNHASPLRKAPRIANCSSEITGLTNMKTHWKPCWGNHTCPKVENR